jgi:hypothetical protein
MFSGLFNVELVVLLGAVPSLSRDCLMVISSCGTPPCGYDGLMVSLAMHTALSSRDCTRQIESPSIRLRAFAGIYLSGARKANVSVLFGSESVL